MGLLTWVAIIFATFAILATGENATEILYPHLGFLVVGCFLAIFLRRQSIISRWGWGSSSNSSQDFLSWRNTVRTRKINDSLYELQEPEPPLTPKMVILFFHGFLSTDSPDNYLETWESEDKSCIWPNTWLAEDFPGARILYVSYSELFGKGSGGNAEMYILGENLASDFLQANIGQTPNCPVILVGHCFGGLVIKEFCLHISNSKNLTRLESQRMKHESFLARVKGIFYYGTPHRGSPSVDKANHRDNPLLGYFKVLSKESSRLNSEFSHLCEVRKWQTKGLGESKKTKQGLFRGVIVAPEASSRDGEQFNVVPTDHVLISKPQSKLDRRFNGLASLLSSIVDNMEVEVLGHQCQGLPSYPVDVEKHAQEVQETLKDISILGICGMGGIGKTTLAKQVYNNLSKDYEYTCFVDNVKGIQTLLEGSILSNFHERGRKVGRTLNWSDFKEKRTLIVMDDIDSEDQLCVLPNLEQFKSGSRIIITTRDKEVLKFYPNHTSTYDVEFLKGDAAKKLFCQHAFGKEDIPAHDIQTSHLNTNVMRVIDKCGGLPLTLEVVGRYLRDHKDSPEIWEETTDKLQAAKSIRGDKNDRVWASLRVSYDALAEEEQQMFIEAGTFFFEQDLDEALSAWSTNVSNSESRWANLVSRSLVKETRTQFLWDLHARRSLEYERKVWVHEQLRDLARSLAKDEINLGSDKFVTMLNANEIKDEIKALRLRETSPIQLDFLLKLKKLRYLDMSRVSFQREGLGVEVLGKSFRSNLSILRCWGSTKSRGQLFPITLDEMNILAGQLFPITLDEMNNLAVLDLGYWYIPKGSLEALGNLTNMRVLKLTHLIGLHSLPENFGNLCHLKSLTLSNLGLQRFPVSLGNLSALEHLNLWDLKCLENLPESFGNLSSLVAINIYRCPNLSSLPLGCNLKALKRLKIDGCPLLDRLPESFSQLSGLQTLYLCNCEGMKELCNSFESLSALRNLFMSSLGIDKLPADFGCLSKLEELSLYKMNALAILPDSIGQLTALTMLTIEADLLEILPESVGLLSSLETLVIRCQNLERLPQSLGQLIRLKKLEVKTLPDTLGDPSRLGIDTVKVLPASKGKVLSQGLRNLSISAFSLESLPSSIGQLSSLQDLKIRCANLKELPESIGRLQCLRKLSIEDCDDLEKLPDQVGDLSLLEELSIDGGSLKNLPESIGRLQSLRKLSLEDCNGLEKLPDQVGDLSLLEELSIKARSLKNLSESIGRLESLQKLKLEAWEGPPRLKWHHTLHI